MRIIFLLPHFCALLIAVSADPPLFAEQSQSTSSCTDLDPKCSVWASQGECQTNAAWMMSNCRRSCQSCQGGEKAWQLRAFLASQYDANNNSAAKNFTINHIIVKSFTCDHIELDEVKQLVRMHGKLVLTWNDTRIAWDKNQWGISWLNFYWIQLWTPQLVQSNSPAAMPATVSSKVLASNYTGQVYMWADYSFNALCDFDYTGFPFDEQKCCFKLDDRRYYQVRFAVDSDATMVAQNSALKTHPAGWKINNIDLSESKYTVKVLSDWSRDPFNIESTNLDICVKLKRDSSYAQAQIIGPAVITAVLTLTSFLVGSFWNQLMFLIASLTLQLLALYPLTTQLPPPSGEVPGALKYCSFNLAMTSLIMVATALLLVLANLNRTLPPPRFLLKVISIFERVFPCITINTDEQKLGEEGTVNMDATKEQTTNKYQWAPVARVLKYVMFILCLILYILIMITCLTGQA